MKEEEIKFKHGILKIEWEEEKPIISLILNQDFLKKFVCYDLNYRGEQHYRLKNKDFEMRFTNRKK